RPRLACGALRDGYGHDRQARRCDAPRLHAPAGLRCACRGTARAPRGDPARVCPVREPGDAAAVRLGRRRRGGPARTAGQFRPPAAHPRPSCRHRQGALSGRQGHGSRRRVRAVAAGRAAAGGARLPVRDRDRGVHPQRGLRV
ncbi:unnamed protein product, partial [Phaeothamnion confervicola]